MKLTFLHSLELTDRHIQALESVYTNTGELDELIQNVQEHNDSHITVSFADGLRAEVKLSF